MNKKKDAKKNLNCPLFNICSGCSINEHLEEPPVLKEALIFFENLGVKELPVFVGAVSGWRCQAKLAVRGTKRHPKIGLFREGTHDIIDIPSCVVHHPKIDEATSRLRMFIKQEEWEPYNEQTHQGLLRYVQIGVERQTGRVQLSLVLNAQNLNPEQQDALERFWQSGADSFWHSIWINYNTTQTNVIFGKQWDLLYGEKFLWEILGRAKVCFLPSSFSQANREAFSQLLEDLVQQVPASARIVEFYAGGGAIGLNLVTKERSVICCEINPQAEICFEESRKQLPNGVSDNISYVVDKAESAQRLLREVDIVVVDPPRKGIDPQLLKAIKSTNIKELVVVSCGWKSFQRDCLELIEGGWKLSWVKVYLFFPGSNHIEIMAIFKSP